MSSAMFKLAAGAGTALVGAFVFQQLTVETAMAKEEATAAPNKSKLQRHRTSGDMAAFASGESAMKSVLSAEGGKPL